MVERIRVSVVYADPQRHLAREIEVAAGATVGEAILASGLLNELRGFAPAAVGIFGRKVAVQQRLRDGDRVELYRPLKLDPKEARRKRMVKR